MGTGRVLGQYASQCRWAEQDAGASQQVDSVTVVLRGYSDGATALVPKYSAMFCATVADFVNRT